MTTHMQHAWLVIFAGVSLAAASATAAGAGEDEYFEALEAGRSSWRLIRARAPHPATPEDVAAAREMLAGVSSDAGCPAYRVIELLRLRLDVQAGRHQEAQDGFLKLADSPGVAPECFLGLATLMAAAKDVPARMAMESCLARLLPMSGWSRNRNARDSEPRGPHGVLGVPPPPPIPRLLGSTKELSAIGHLFQNANLHDRAWVAFVEAAYATAPNHIRLEWHSETWFSPDTAFLWRNAAENAWKAGEEVLGYDYLTKFAIFGSEAQFDEAKQIAARRKTGRPQEDEPEISRAERQKALKDILPLYAELNAHPRALELIERYQGWFDDPDDLYAQYSERWQEILRLWRLAATRIVLFGVTVTDEVAPATIRIPPPCRPESIKEAKAKAIEILQARQ